MKLEQYQRVKFLTHIRPLFIKNRCEICGETNDLELHHEEQFIILLKNTLDELSLEYLEDTSMYTEKQLKTITDLILGKQLQIKYATLCKRCHIDIHNIQGKEKLFFKVKKIADIKKLEEEFINKYKGVNILNDDKIKLEKIFRDCGYNGRTFGKKKANMFLEDNNVLFVLESARIRIDGRVHRIWQLVKKE